MENTFENLTISEFHSAFIASTTKKLENLTNNPVIQSCQKLTHPTNYVYEPAECRRSYNEKCRTYLLGKSPLGTSLLGKSLLETSLLETSLLETSLLRKSLLGGDRN